MHTQSMSESEGDFSGWKLSEGTTCPKCGYLNVSYSIWESKCGGYEDVKYRCNVSSCKHTWWVDGPDS